ncbi:MAG: hypothetical protein LBJ17_09425, partial [Dysgonamonadaceae bacterium]|nr:hypothetical protein [Dysgonamonadaceae bacterium]
SKRESDRNFQLLIKALIGKTTDSISTQIIELRDQVLETQNNQSRQIQLLKDIHSTLGSYEEGSLLTQIQLLRADQNDYSKETYEEYIQDDIYDFSDEGCGEGWSCSECTNCGCPSHPCN